MYKLKIFNYIFDKTLICFTKLFLPLSSCISVYFIHSFVIIAFVESLHMWTAKTARQFFYLLQWPTLGANIQT